MIDLKTSMEIAQVLASIFAGIGLVYAGWQIKLLKKIHADNHEWNRRFEAQNAVDKIRLLAPITVELNELFNTTNSTEPILIKRILEAFKNDRSIQIKVHEVLNAYESLARGVYQRIYDEQVVKSARRGAMIQQFEAFSSYIKYRRKTVHNNAYIQIEALVNKWKAADNSGTYRDPTG